MEGTFNANALLTIQMLNGAEVDLSTFEDWKSQLARWYFFLLALLSSFSLYANLTMKE